MKKNLIKVGMFVKLALANKTVAQKIVQGNTIKNAITGNAYFPTPPSLIAFETVITALSDAAIAAENGGKLERANLDTAEALYDVAAAQMGLYVQGIADADPLHAVEIIISAGMDTRKTPEPWLVPNPVIVLQALFTGQPDSILLKWKRSQFTMVLEVWMTTTPGDANSWKFLATTSKNKMVVSSLTAATQYSFRLISVGTAGRSVPSVAVSQFTAQL